MQDNIKRDHYDNGQAENYYTEGDNMVQVESVIILSLLEKVSNLQTANILDAGCGGGVHLRNLRKLSSGAVYGIDVSEEMLEKCRNIQPEKESPIIYEKVDLVDEKICSVLRVPEGFFDIALCNWVINHARNVDELKKMIGNVGASLKTGGKFFGMAINPALTPKDFGKFLKYSFIFEVADKTKETLKNEDLFYYTLIDLKTNKVTLEVPDYYYDKETFKRVFEEEGFKVNMMVPIDEIVLNGANFDPKMVEGRNYGIIFEATRL